jgi:hypothetical protein
MRDLDMADVKTLERIAVQLRTDADKGWNLSNAAMRSIAGLIDAAIGAPLSWPSRVAGADAANEFCDGDPAGRRAFNAGVKWAVEHYNATTQIGR